MATAPSPVAYDPSAGGLSQGAAMAQVSAANTATLAQDKFSYDKQFGQGQNLYANVDKPALQSSMGAAGQSDSTAAGKALGQQLTAHDLSQSDLTSGFNNVQNDMARNQAYAAMGIIL